MAVLVRPAKSESARQRVENLLRHWEVMLESPLPRPVVLEGDLSEPDLGLDNRAVCWIERNCESVVHNAASLAFRDESDGEPHLSNVEGTRRMLELCRCTGVRQFHHVSTAYVCGLREGRILESEADVGQTPGNVYEKTKLQAELLVRGADFIDRPTIYRPSIIVGDSQTGYTTTYHGFYAPLKLAHTLASKVRWAAGGHAGQPVGLYPGNQGRRPQEFRARRLGFGSDLPHPQPAGTPRHNLPCHVTEPAAGPGDGRGHEGGRGRAVAHGRSRLGLEHGQRVVYQDVPRPVGDLRCVLARRSAVRHDEHAPRGAAPALPEPGPGDDVANGSLRHRRQFRPRPAERVGGGRSTSRSSTSICTCGVCTATRKPTRRPAERAPRSTPPAARWPMATIVLRIWAFKWTAPAAANGSCLSATGTRTFRGCWRSTRASAGKARPCSMSTRPFSAAWRTAN